MMVEVRYFASLVDCTGVESETIEVTPEDDIATLLSIVQY